MMFPNYLWWRVYAIRSIYVHLMHVWCYPDMLKTLLGIHNHINNSQKRLSIFKEFQIYLELKQHKMLHPSQTRWLSVVSCWKADTTISCLKSIFYSGCSGRQNCKRRNNIEYHYSSNDLCLFTISIFCFAFFYWSEFGNAIWRYQNSCGVW